MVVVDGAVVVVGFLGGLAVVDVEVGTADVVEVVDVDDVVVVGSTAPFTGGMGLPPRFAAWNVPPYSPSLTASAMNRLKTVAGNDPPLTLRPRTLVIRLLAPSGYPIQTAAVRRGV